MPTPIDRLRAEGREHALARHEMPPREGERTFDAAVVRMHWAATRNPLSPVTRDVDLIIHTLECADLLVRSLEAFDKLAERGGGADLDPVMTCLAAYRKARSP